MAYVEQGARACRWYSCTEPTGSTLMGAAGELDLWCYGA
jgi:hypothetical protein